MGVKVREKVAGSGVWWIFVVHKGRRKSKRVGSREAAKAAARKIEARLTLGDTALPVQKQVVQTVEEFYKKFEATHMQAAIRPSTACQYRINFRIHILPELGKLPTDEVSRERVKAFVSHLCAKKAVVAGKGYVERPLSKDSVRMILAALSVFFSCAQEAGLVLANPATRMGKNYRQTRRLREEIQPLTASEVPVFLRAALETFPDYYPLFLCAVHTGLRSGELAGLQWADLDFNGRFLTVRRTIVGKRIHRPKTNKVRRVDLSDELMRILPELRRRRHEKMLAAGLNEIPEWVFCNREGKTPDMQNIKNRAFHPCLAKAQLRRIKFHDLRHTFASLLIQNGESLA